MHLHVDEIAYTITYRELIRRRVLVDPIFEDAPDNWVRAVKLLLPLGGTLAYVIDAEQTAWIMTERQRATAQLNEHDPADGFATMAAWRVGLGPAPVPSVIVDRFDELVSEARLNAQSIALRSIETPNHADRNNRNETEDALDFGRD